MSHITRENHTNRCDFWYVISHIHMCHMRHSNENEPIRDMWYDSFILVTRIFVWLIHIGDTNLPYGICDMNESYHVTNMNESCVTWGSFISHIPYRTIDMLAHSHLNASRDTWLIHIGDTNLPYGICDMTHSYLWHESFSRVTKLFTCHITHPHQESCEFLNRICLLYRLCLLYSLLYRLCLLYTLLYGLCLLHRICQRDIIYIRDVSI